MHEQPPLIPMPAKVEPMPGRCRLAAEVAAPAGGVVAPWIAAWLRDAHPGEGQHASITLTLETNSAAGIAPSGYELTLGAEGATLIAADDAGLCHGVQALRQLLFAYGRDLPAMRIADAPRFAWRGVHLDVARHFFPVEDVLRLIDLAALHRLNVFHWHLTDDQGWRLEITSKPRLTEVGSRRPCTKRGHARDADAGYDDTPHSGYYTHDDVRRVVRFAAERGITVVPEIDLPGHTQAAIAAYPELGHGLANPAVLTTWGISKQVLNPEPATLAFFEAVLEEVLDLFPSPWIHLGGDEAPTDEWEQSPGALARADALGYAGPGELQHLFTTHFDRWLTGHGRRLMGWDEIWERSGTALPADALVVGWRGEGHAVAAAKAGYDVVMAPGVPTYLNEYQADPATEPLAIGGLNTLDMCVAWEPVPAALAGEGAAQRVLGGQAQLWSEYIPDRQRLDYMAFPRLCAVAEALWSSPEQRDARPFASRLPGHLKLLDALGVGYRRP